MSSRITLDQSENDGGASRASSVEPAIQPHPSRHIVRADWEDATSDALMLYVAEEPRIGDEFSYNDLRWRVIDYRDGWIAELLVR